MTPFETARCISGCAARNALFAADLSPVEMASSTCRKYVRTRERRALLTAVRREILRTIFFADDVLAMSFSFRLQAIKRERLQARARVYSDASMERQLASPPHFAPQLTLTIAAEKGRSARLDQSAHGRAASRTGRAFAPIHVEAVLKIAKGAVGAGKIPQCGPAGRDRVGQHRDNTGPQTFAAPPGDGGGPSAR